MRETLAPTPTEGTRSAAIREDNIYNMRLQHPPPHNLKFSKSYLNNLYHTVQTPTDSSTPITMKFTAVLTFLAFATTITAVKLPPKAGKGKCPYGCPRDT
ncbi:hypothetical protein EG328_006950 [Venturia inaequalis]|uniref:Uncharacterized protein n=1 Tax=Venturia inaequalis TaxID=5025 RepID=A0A8H3UEX8_VENIN|nr:hypothetical protein EG328_006950 [Venturia inaequalis]RDI83678.1 hypothetical protein Vi05172_g6243 [Venturia inaequalis]